MLDVVIKGGTIVDGSGRAAFVGDLGVRAGRIVAMGAPGTVDESAARIVDASGLVVTPGFVDPHTHYDAQLWWDPLATPSSWHGVTSIVGGNCGFALAPLHDVDADYTRKMMAKVEGMPLAALENGLPWSWETFEQYLNGLDGRVAVNAGFLVGHCALRRYVMGADSVGREATVDELTAMERELRRSIEAGGLGFSTTRSSTHSDGAGDPVPSRWASEDEVLRMCRVVGAYPGTTLEAMMEGCIGRFTADEIELLATMSATARRPLNWNVLTVDAQDPTKVDHQLGAARRARELGGRVVALTMPIAVPMNMSFNSFCALWLLPGWGDVLNVDPAERMRRLSDPSIRAKMLSDAAGSKFGRLSEMGNFVIGDTYAEVNQRFRGRRVDDIARELGVDDFAALASIVVDDELRTVLWPVPAEEDDAQRRTRAGVWVHDDIMLGGSDAGAHLDRMCGSPYPTKFLGDVLRGHQLLDLSTAVRLITSVPADLFGLRERGRLAPGCFADIVVFDPTTIDAGSATLVTDLPGDSSRLIAPAVGVRHVFVNGVETIVDGTPTGATPGTVLRSGRDTVTVAT
ncbi:MAG: amidohydrolase family protein [Acidimicrobiia bacterium]